MNGWSMSSWQFWIDRGGTFTDVVARDAAGAMVTRKLLSENPGQYRGRRHRRHPRYAGASPPDAAPIPRGAIAQVRMGTTVATNALLERRGTPVLLVINQGLGDLLRIGNQARPRLFDLDIRLPRRPLCRCPGNLGPHRRRRRAKWRPLDEAAIRAALETARAGGLDAVAIALMHAWAFPGA